MAREAGSAQFELRCVRKAGPKGPAFSVEQMGRKWRSDAMLRPILLALPLLVAGCATPHRLPERLHVMAHDRDPNQSAICMAPNGENVFWQQDSSMRDPVTGEGYYSCPAPAFFVLMPRCSAGEETWMNETPDHRALRVRFGRDGSFHGDSYQGRRFCMPPSPH